MLNKLKQYRGALRAGAIATAALALVITLSMALSSDAYADGPNKRVTSKPTPAAKKSPARSSPFVKKPAITGVININTASAATLQKLPGIGPSKAKRIVAYRTRRGPFRRVRDLRRVKGIGRKSLAKMSKHLTVKGASTAR